VIARQDDDPLAHRQRIAAYSEHAAALFDHYFRSGVAFEVNGDQSIEHVNAEIRRRVDAR
jgi:adenylate kinase family enzyme